MEQTKLLTVLSGVLLALAVLWFLGRPGPAEDPVWDAEATLELWTVRAEDVDGIDVEGGVSLRRTRGRWLLVSPVETLADAVHVDAMLDDLEDASPAIPLPDADPAEVGLDPARRTEVTVLVGDRRETLYVGDAAAVGWKTYVQRPDGPIAIAPGELRRTVLRDWRDLRSPALFDFDLARVRRVEVTSPQGTVAARLDGSSWWLEGFSRADPAGVEELLIALRRLEFEVFRDGVAPDGIAEPTHRATVELDDGTVLSAAFGDALPGGVLAVRGDGVEGEVAAIDLQVFGRGPKDLGDPRAFPVGEGDEVEVSVEGAPVAVDAEALGKVPMLYVREPVPAVQRVWATVRIREGNDRMRVIEVGQRVGDYRVARDLSGGNPYFVPGDAIGG